MTSTTAPQGARVLSVPGDDQLALAEVRRDGHLYADLDPLRFPASFSGRPAEAEREAVLAAWRSRLAHTEDGAPTGNGDAPPASLVSSYCGTLALEADHLRDAGQRAWLYERMETRDFAPSEDAALQRARAVMLLSVDAFERYLQQHFVGEKTLSIEGLDATVLMTEELVHLAAASAIERVAIGMAHRGRLSILTHVCGLPLEEVMRDLESTRGTCQPSPRGITGDVLQHLGHEGVRELNGRRVPVWLLPNPSHLEFVSPVAIGATRATIDAGRRSLALLMHGDAAFTGQGVAAETLNLSGLGAFSAGGAIHIIQNNRLGFTTEALEGRSTRWPSDIAHGYQIPVLHVNADDVLACLHAARIAFAFRERFGWDIVIHAVGYRRMGHTEADEPRFTQPALYRVIDKHPRVVETFTKELLASGCLRPEDLAAERVRIAEQLAASHAATRAARPREDVRRPSATLGDAASAGVTGVSEERLVALARRIGTLPAGFRAHPKVAKVLERRIAEVEEHGSIDWPHAELLALAACVEDGLTVHLCGQDVLRGTFSQRHVAVRDVESDAWHCVLGAVDPDGARLHVANSPLSEASVLGFEFGYSLGNPAALPIWEAQFGDFANGAQVIIDQFVSSGYAKWGSLSRLVLLLPHGYEGAGPEHSSARVERYLQLCGEDNLAIVAPTTAAQYFHVLRWQALRELPCPLVVFTPKSLLRAKTVASRIDEFGHGLGFTTTITSPEAAAVKRVVLATGKFAVELDTAARAQGAPVVVCRVEQLAPWPSDAVGALLARHPDAEVLWAQEEPENMGALHFALHALRESHPGRTVAHVARPARGAVAEGGLVEHKAAQARLVATALDTDTDR